MQNYEKTVYDRVYTYVLRLLSIRIRVSGSHTVSYSGHGSSQKVRLSTADAMYTPAAEVTRES